MHIIQATNNNDAYIKILEEISNKGNLIKSRGLEFLEISPVLIIIENILDNKIYDEKRKWSYRVAKAEYDWYMSGSNLLKDIIKDMPVWEKFSDDGIHIRSAYGYRWKNQLPDIIDKLKNDFYTRKAVISLYDGIEDIGYRGKDTVCTLTIQFMFRDNKLNMYVNMRSNDLIWGFCNDAFSFTELLKHVCNELNIKVGTYYHYVASMHIYDTHYHLLRR
jgi:thymidylate synthase